MVSLLDNEMTDLTNLIPHLKICTGANQLEIFFQHCVWIIKIKNAINNATSRPLAGSIPIVFPTH